MSEHGLKTLLDQLETHEFAARVNVASDPRTALTIAQADPVTQELLASVQKAPASQSTLLERIAFLAKQEIDPRFMSPWDTALLALISIVQTVAPFAAGYAARLALRAPNTFWAAKFAMEVLTERTRVEANVQILEASASDVDLVDLSGITFGTAVRSMSGSAMTFSPESISPDLVVYVVDSPTVRGSAAVHLAFESLTDFDGSLWDARNFVLIRHSQISTSNDVLETIH
jgi:hypothetical protein